MEPLPPLKLSRNKIAIAVFLTHFLPGAGHFVFKKFLKGALILFFFLLCFYFVCSQAAGVPTEIQRLVDGREYESSQLSSLVRAIILPVIFGLGFAFYAIWDVRKLRESALTDYSDKI